MTQSFELDSGFYFYLIFLIGCVIGMFSLLWNIFRGWRAIIKNQRIAKPKEVEQAWSVVEKAARRQVFARLFMLLVTAVFFWILWQNAYVKFSTITLNKNVVSLGYLLRSDRTFDIRQITAVKIVNNKSSGCIKLFTVSQCAFSSVTIMDKAKLKSIASAINLRLQHQVKPANR